MNPRADTHSNTERLRHVRGSLGASAASPGGAQHDRERPPRPPALHEAPGPCVTWSRKPRARLSAPSRLRPSRPPRASGWRFPAPRLRDAAGVSTPPPRPEAAAARGLARTQGRACPSDRGVLDTSVPRPHPVPCDLLLLLTLRQPPQPGRTHVGTRVHAKQRRAGRRPSSWTAHGGTATLEGQDDGHGEALCVRSPLGRAAGCVCPCAV